MKEDVFKLMGRAYDCLSDAQLILSTGRYNGVPNRSYYAIFDAVNALLRLHETYAKTHRGAKNTFSKLFILTNQMPVEANLWLEKCFELRQSGDYDFDHEVTEAVQSIEYAKEFLLYTEAYLREQNLSS